MPFFKTSPANRWLAAACLAALPVLPAPAAPPSHPLPRLVEKDGRHALLVDNAPYLMLGAQVNNSSAWPGELPRSGPR